MKTKTIFKTLALAMLMPTMLLTTACSSDDNDIVNTENPANTQKGYALPVTINVTRQGDEGTTRASYNESTHKLSFSTGDKLFVIGSHTDAGQFAGTLDYDAVSGKFSGTVTTKNEYTGTIDDLMENVIAALLPAGYGSYEFFSFEGSGYEAGVNYYLNKAFALTKAAAVEQFSFESAFSYSSGFALAPMNAIASFTISGLTANKKVTVNFDTNGNGVISGDVTTNATGVATFAVGVSPGRNLENCTLTVDGNNIAMPTKTTESGHIYNISRSVPRTLADVFTEGAEVNVKVNTANGFIWYNAAGTYSSGSYTGVTQTNKDGNESLNKGISMTKDGNNLVVWMKNTYNGITITFNTTNNTYTVTAEENVSPYRMTTFNSITINGVDITGQLSEYVPPMETITFSSGSGTWDPDTDETLFTGTHFNVAGSGYDDSYAAFTVNKWNYVKISATDGKTITKVVFNYHWKANLGSLAFSSGTFDDNATVNNVNASTLTVTSSHAAGTRFSGVTIYYE